MSEIFIYGLVCPIENKIMYVGKSKDAEHRLIEHIASAKYGNGTKKSDWLRNLLNLGLVPSIEIIERCSRREWRERENYWIDYHKSINPDLVNSPIGHFSKGSKPSPSSFQKRTVKKETDSHNLVFRIRDVADKKDLNKSQIHYALGISYPTVSRMWDGDLQHIDVDILDRLCEFLDCSPGELIQRVPD